MVAAVDRFEFAPPPTPGIVRAIGLAVLAHAFLLAALTWGVHWRSEAVSVNVEAELWAALPQPAAPKLIEVPPEPAPEPPPALEPVPVQPEPPKVDIALEQEKLRQQKERDLALQQQQQKLKQDRLLLEKKRLQEKQDKERKAAEEKKKVELEKQRKQALQAQEEAKRIEAQREKNLQRIAGLAGATGSPNASGTAQRSAGPTPGYDRRLAALFKRNIIFSNPETISGNPQATVEVRVSAAGRIINWRLTTSSGVPAWDSAVLRAVEKTERVPPDENGNFVLVFPVNFGPKD